MVKIVVNMGVSASLEKSAVDDAAKDLALITGRKPAISKSRHNIANFKLREGQPIGCRVTLRRDAMYEFFDRLVATALPRIRDFRGLSPRKFDGRGQLHVRRGRPDDFPGDRTGQDQAPAGHGHHDCDHAPANERAGAGFVETDGFSPAQTNKLIMAKKAWIERNKRKAETVKKYRRDPRGIEGQARLRRPGQIAAQRQPTRLVNRCSMSGRRHGYLRKFGCLAADVPRSRAERFDSGRDESQLVGD